MKPLLLVLVFCATTVQAEPLVIPLSVYAAAASADLHSMYRGLQYQGVREANPLGAWLSDNPEQLVVFSSLAEAGTVYAVHRLWGKRHPRWERVILYTAAAGRIAIAARNYRGVAQLQREGRPLKGARYVWPTP